jgi:predicted naringenin-chalcone synthase
MKKWLGIFLVMLMMLTCTVAGAEENTDVNAYLGDWQLTLMEEDGVQIDAAEYGLVMILTLNEDGTAALAVEGEESDEMAWMLDAEGLKIGGEGEWLLAEIQEDGSISIEDSGTNMVFVRDVNAYLGDWYLTLMEEDGVQIDAAEYGLVMILTLNEDGTAALAVEGEEPDEMAWMLDAEGLKIGGEGEWLLAEIQEDGSISIEDSGTKMVFVREASENVSE